MRAPGRIPHAVLSVQIETSDPATSAWVTANAGSGKTHVLAQRVIRLLLGGTDPAKILCLTFTKAAAATMANRVFKTLAAWTSLDDGALDEAITKLDGKAPDAARRTRARRLFAQALDTPGGLKVQTIHAFCTRLLHQFPFEANVAAGFAVLEERAEADLLAKLRLQVLLDAAGAPDSPLGRALATAITAAADRTFGEVIDEAIFERDAVMAWIAHAGGVAAAVAELSGMLGVRPDETVAQIEKAMVEGPMFPPSEWESAAAMLAGGLKTDCDRATQLRDAIAARDATRIDHYLSVFFNVSDGEPRKRIVTAGLSQNHPELAQRLLAEQQRLVDLEARRRAAVARDRTGALLAIASAVIERYRIEKEKRGLLDYQDLIDRALLLLDKVDAAWVHYKLDLGIDHVLIDEAQDTSPTQWQIIKHLVAEFTAGHGARGSMPRSIFAVGDEKQSIFSFQGAEPRELAAMRSYFERAHRDGEREFRARQFKHSFRSGVSVLSAVDAVFSDARIFASVTSDEAGVPPHEALPDTPAGLVEIWPMIEASKRPEMEAWDAPFDTTSETSPPVVLAERIAATIAGWIRGGRSPGEVLVLVRQRGGLFEAVIRALKNAEIPVAGADRMVLTEHIAVMDLMVLADALLLPQDDLALATVLKSPLFGLDEDLLLTLAAGRRGTLRAALRQHAARNAQLRDIAARLDQLAVAARRDTPFAFYARLLGPDGGRKRILRRLGPEAADALDEFLNLALDYETRETASLQGFVAWLRAAATQVKRDMDVVRDEVRVMTVHGAKGLEAPIVILADTTTRPQGPRDPRLLRLPAEKAPPGTPDRIVWAAAQDTDVPITAHARLLAQGAAEDEYRRLLYVGMTRAAERLIVCGQQGIRKRPQGCWYDLVGSALEPDAIEELADDGEGMVLRWRRDGPIADESTTRAEVLTLRPEAPSWLTTPVRPEAAATRPVFPSTAGPAARPESWAAAASQGDPLLRGRLMHRLLQALPGIAPERRVDAGRRHLARAAAHLDELDREAMLREALAVLEHPEFAPLFAAQTRAEVPIVARIKRSGAPLAVSGQVDRLAVTDAGVYLADYKSDRPAPGRIEDVPSAYVTQLALYRAALMQVFPARPIRAALLWTEVPRLMTLDDGMLDAALAAVK